MLVASLEEISPSKVNGRVLCLALTLCEEAFRALKKRGFITGHSYVQIISLICSDDFKEMNRMQKSAL